MSLLFCMTLNLLAQEKNSITENKVLEIDFRTKRLVSLPDLKRDDFYHVRITGINMNLYKVTVGSKDSAIVSEVGGIPTFSTISIDGLTDILSKLAPLFTFSSTQSEKINAKALIKKEVEINLDLSFVHTKFFDEQIELVQKRAADLKQLTREIDDQNRVVSIKLLSYASDLDSKFYKQLNNPPFDLNNFFSEMDGIRKRTAALIIENQKQQTVFAKFINSNPLPKENEDLKETKNNISKALEVTDALANDVYISIGAEKVNSVLSGIIKAENADTTFLSLPIQFKEDVATVDISIEPANVDKEKAIAYTTSIRFPKSSNNFIGVGSSFYWSNLSNESYSVKSTVFKKDSAEYSIVKENKYKYKNDYEIGIAALLHVGRKIGSSNFGGQFTIGPAFSISNVVKARLVAGGGFSYGKRQLVTINLLGIAGYVDRLSAVYDESTIYAIKPENITISKLDYKLAISIGYIYNF